MKRIGLADLHRGKPGDEEPPPESALPTAEAAGAPTGQPPSSPLSRSKRALSLVRGHRVGAVAGLSAAGIIVIIVAAAASGAFGQRGPTPAPATGSPEATAESTASVEPTRRPTPMPTRRRPQTTATPGPEDSPEPTLVPGTWPITISDYTGSLLLGSDGTIYIDWWDPIGPSGRPKAGWTGYPTNYEGQEVLDGQPVALGSDGTIYFMGWIDDTENGSYRSYLWALDATGKPRDGWPVEVESDMWDDMVLPGPSGTVYLLSSWWDADSHITIEILGPSGKLRAKASPSGSLCDQAITPDGTLFVTLAPEEGGPCKVRAFSAAGKELTKSSAATWDDLVMAQDGTVAAVGYDPEPAGHGVAQTRLALLGTDGLPLPGWPVTFEGEAFAPTFGPDGAIYVTVLGLGAARSRLEALDPDGGFRPGWPIEYPAGYGPRFGSESPVIGPGGGIYAAAVNQSGLGYVLGFDADGATLPGWPYQLPKPFGEFSTLVGPVMVGPEWLPNPTPLFVANTSGGLLYLALQDRILALDSAGKVAPGWPYKPRATEITWSVVAGTPGGGIVVLMELVNAQGDTSDPLAVCLTSTGTTPK